MPKLSPTPYPTFRGDIHSALGWLALENPRESIFLYNDGLFIKKEGSSVHCSIQKNQQSDWINITFHYLPQVWTINKIESTSTIYPSQDNMVLAIVWQVSSWFRHHLSCFTLVAAKDQVIRNKGSKEKKSVQDADQKAAGMATASCTELVSQ